MKLLKQTHEIKLTDVEVTHILYHLNLNTDPDYITQNLIEEFSQLVESTND